MQNKSNKNSHEIFSEKGNEESKNIICKEGFCFIPNHDENKSINNKNINIFDPI